MPDVSVGIIGYGFMGRAHTFAYVTIPMYYDRPAVKVGRLVMCTRSDANVVAAEATGYYDRVVRDWRRLIDDQAIDIIHICTPNNLHYDMLAAAIEAGKYIYCDKPLTTTYAQARNIADLIRRTGYDKTAQMHMNVRFFPAILRAKQLVDDGALGDVLSFRVRQLHGTNVDPDIPVSWKSDKDVGGGGVILDLGPHAIDLITHLIGRPKRIFCRAENFTPVRPDGTGGTVRREGEELAVMIIELQSGGIGTLEVSKVATGANTELQLEVHGRRAAMTFDMMKPNWLGFYDTADPETPQGGTRGFKNIDCIQHYPNAAFPPGKVAGGWLRPHVHCLHHFLDAVAHDRPADPSLHRGVEIQKWLHLAYQSAQTAQWRNA